jgi:hypothetical protein
MSARHCEHVCRLEIPWQPSKAFLLLLAHRFNDKKGYACPSVDSLAWTTRKDPRVIRRWIHEDKYISEEIRYEEGRGRGNVSKFYFRNVAWPAEKPDTKPDIKPDAKPDISPSANKEESKKEKIKGGSPLDGLRIFARDLLNRAELPMTYGNENAVLAAMKCEIRTGKTPDEAYTFILDGTLNARPYHEVTRFFFEDAKYRKFARSPGAERELEQQKDPGVCKRCGGEKFLLQAAHISGPRLIPCPDCHTQVKRPPQNEKAAS